jgi:hypothetical protein
MASTNAVAVNETTLYGQIPNYVVARPYKTIASSASIAVSSADFAAAQTLVVNNLVDTMYALGYWATSG